MAGRRWTVLVVPQGAGSSRELQVSERAVKALLGFVGVVAVAAVGLTYAAISKAVDLSRLDRLERRNEVLATELERMTATVTVLSDTVATLTDRDRELRLLAGLAPNDRDVLQAGVGGPSVPGSAGDLVLAEYTVGQEAMSTRQGLEALIRRARFLSASYREALDTIVDLQDQLRRTPSIMPTTGFISSRFSQSRIHPIYKVARPHEGIDVVAERGTPILAAAAGRVVDVGVKIGYGKTVVIDHGDGVRTRYAHANRLLVQLGQRVSRGDVIAEVGRTGTATNNHLHYEVLVNGRPVDPLTYVFNERVVD